MHEHLPENLPQKPLQYCEEIAHKNFVCKLREHLAQSTSPREKLIARFLHTENCGSYLAYDISRQNLDVVVYYSMRLRRRLSKKIRVFADDLSPERGYAVLNDMDALDRPIVAAAMAWDCVEGYNDPQEKEMLHYTLSPDITEEEITRIRKEARDCWRFLPELCNDIRDGTLGRRSYYQCYPFPIQNTDRIDPL